MVKLDLKPKTYILKAIILLVSIIKVAGDLETLSPLSLSSLSLDVQSTSTLLARQGLLAQSAGQVDWPAAGLPGLVNITIIIIIRIVSNSSIIIMMMMTQSGGQVCWFGKGLLSW